MPATTTTSALSQPDSHLVGLDGAPAGDTASTNSARRLPIRVRGFRLPLVAGSLLLIIGLVAVGYGVFQLVITDMIAARAQEQLTGQFTARLEAATIVDTTLSREQFTAALATRDDLTVATPDPGEFDDENDVPVLAAPASAQLEPLLPLAESPWVYEAPPEQGEALGRIVIPQADVDWVIVEGVTPTDLRKGPGHMPDTALPGQYGNAVVSGHRTTYGAPFFDLDVLQPGDRFTVETLIGTHTYEVVETRIVEPTDVWVTGQWEGAWLTLTTCNPRYSAAERLIVFSRMVDGPNASSVAAQHGTTYAVPEPAATTSG